MNIFYIDRYPSKCARMLDDKRLNKMCVETMQMVSTAIHTIDDPGVKRRWPNGLYKPAFQHHPCTKWVKSSWKNFAWTVTLAKAMYEEYQYRFHKTRKNHYIPYDMIDDIAEGRFDGMKYAMPMEYTRRPNCTNLPNPVGFDADADYHLELARQYRDYMNDKWRADKHPPAWTRRNVPGWFDPAIPKILR